MENNKKFLTIDEQIKLLEERGLKISDKNKLAWYLTSYNYQNFINGYNDYFMINNDRTTNKYKENATSEGIIELFNFDRYISKIFLSEIQNIERMIGTSLAYIICQELDKNNIPNGQLFKIDKKQEVYKKLFRHEFNWYEFSHIVQEEIKKQNHLCLKYKIPFPNWEDYDFKDKNVFNDDNYKNVPLWFTIIYLSFGKIIKLLENTKEEVFTKIIKNTKLSFDTNLSKKEIVYILTTLKKIRNRICHNNVLFKFWVRNQVEKSGIRKILNNNNCSKIKLFHISELIENIYHNKNSGYIKQQMCKKINEFKNIDNDIVKQIKEWMGYK